MKESSSYPTVRKILPDLKAIKECGIKAFIRQQRKGIKLLERMIRDFDDGRSKSYYCRSAAWLDSGDLQSALAAAGRKIRAEHVPADDVKTRARILRSLLDGLALKAETTRSTKV
jgi:hypothetical protein